MRRRRAGFGRQTKVWLLVSVFSVAGFSARAHAQYLCSAGSNDGKTCESHGDCPSGACVVVQGVCNDEAGYPCDCPGATCNGTTCTGGPFSGQSCSTDFNCDTGVACQGSQKVCVGSGESGILPSGYPCLNDQQCESSQCRSTGLVCKAGTAYSSYPCSQDSDCCIPEASCPAGACFSPATGVTPTSTATSPRTVTATRTGATATPTPSPSVRASVTATSPTAVISVTPVTPTVTPRPHRTLLPAQLYEAIGEGAGCATAGDGGWSLAVLAGAVVLWAARRRPGARRPPG
jgi:hypothetical protein